MENEEKDYKKMSEFKKTYEKMEMSEEQLEAFKNRIMDAKIESKRQKAKRRMHRMSVAAAVVAAFIVLPNTSGNVAYAMSNLPLVGRLVEVVTLRDYKYEGNRQMANITVPGLVADGKALSASDTENGVQDKLKKTTDEINAEIQKITDRMVAEFEESVQDEEGYQDVLVKSEILATTEDNFTLKLICYHGSGSGLEKDYFYTIDLKTGERLELKDLFAEGTDYMTPISDNIKEQMRQQMASDENVSYWLDDTEIPEWNFETISDETSFYLNSAGNIVISFSEGDVAPMYMGCVEFTIPNEVVEDILK